MKKALSIVLTLVLVFSIVPTGIFSINASAESTVVNVYDAETLTTALTTANADVVLWNDVTYSGSVEVLCHSIDLNGYKLVYKNKMNLSSQVEEFVILDNLFSNDAENTGKLTVENGVKFSQSSFVIESGEISINKGVFGDGDFVILNGKINICGSNGSSGSNGASVNDMNSMIQSVVGGTPKYRKVASSGINGADGSVGVIAKTLRIEAGKIEIRGGNGGEGGDGGSFNYMVSYRSTGHTKGGGGGNGADGGDGASAIELLDSLLLKGGVVTLIGGDAGLGGNGGDGGDYYSDSGNGGDGGDGGDNGNGACGIIASHISVDGGTLFAYGGKVHTTRSAGGRGGVNSVGGNVGSTGISGLASLTGGAGIYSNITVLNGVVNAIGTYQSAGIGGAGNPEQKAGVDVRINGGYVLAQGDGNGFDIGGGYYNGVGTPGTLEVTGGTLEFMTYERATNVSSPVFKNCTITGDGAYQHEGTYNADGKFTVTVNDINIDPTTCVGYDEVIVSANVRISRSTNITTPKMKGYISFKLDGREFATASITDAVSTDGVITATASTIWTAVEGEHRLSAGYVPGDNDMYAFGGTYSESADIPLHTHEWNSEYTIDVEPTCTIPGSKSIHCSICDVQKDFATVDATGHDYANNQCQNCQEFLPLVVFKDYDGTVLSSEYYYLGDSIVEPNKPDREADNIYTYTFIGWDKEVTVCDGDAVYTAVYESTPIEYTVVFKNYDGTVLSSNTYHYGDAVVVPSIDPLKPSDLQYEYIFAGWDSVVCACNGDKVYTAVFTSEFVEYTVTFKNHDGSIISTKTYRYGDTVEIPADPNKASDTTYTYSFAGWDKPITICTGNTTYTATYTPSYIDYTVVFKNYNGVVLSTKTYHYGDNIIAPSTPTKPADNTYIYTFVGWDNPVVNCGGDATYTATYNSTYIDYTVTFKNWNGDILSTKTYHYGDTVIAPNTPTKSEDDEYTYIFAGWDSSVVACSGNKTYIATFNSIRKYVVGDIDGVEGVTDRDAVYLLYHTFLSDIYPVNQDCDFNGDGEVNDKDAVYLLYYTFLPDLYPIN